MQNVIYKICEKLKGYKWATESFEVLEAKRYSDDTCEITARLENEDIEDQLTQDIIYNICSRLQGYHFDTEYFEVLSVKPYKHNEYIIDVKLVKTEAENEKVARNESNK